MVSPVVDSCDEDELDIDPKPEVDDDPTEKELPSSATIVEKNMAFPSSAVLRLAHLHGAAPFTGSSSSNQDLEAQMLHARPTSAQKYAVLGQKQQWRRNRAHRSRHRHTITPVATSEADCHGSNEPSPSQNGSSSSSNMWDGTETQGLLSNRFLASARSTGSPPLSARSENDHSLPRSSGRSESTYASESERPLFVVAKQKGKYTARVNVPGHKPLYLGPRCSRH